MIVHNAMWNLKAVIAGLYQRRVFFAIFIGVVAGPLALVAIIGPTTQAREPPGLIWFFITVALLLVIGTGIGLSVFRREATALSVTLNQR